MPKKQASIDGIDTLEDNPEFASASAAFHRTRLRFSAAKKQRETAVEDVISATLNHELEPDGLRDTCERLTVRDGEMKEWERQHKQARDRLKGIIEAHTEQ